MLKTITKIEEDVEAFIKGTPKYRNAISEMYGLSRKYLNVDYTDFAAYSPDFVILFSNDIDRLLKALNKVLYETLKLEYGEYAENNKDQLTVRISNYPLVKSPREIDAKLIGKMVSVYGMIVRASIVQPLASELTYICPENHTTKIIQQELMIRKPTKCSQCSSKILEPDTANSKYINFQFLRMQELPEDLPAGHMPNYLDITAVNDLISTTRPGDRIVLTGIVRIEKDYENVKSNMRVFRLRIDANNIEFFDAKDDRSSEKFSITKEEEERIKNMMKQDNAYDKLIQSFAPHIYGYDVIKEAIMLLVAGAPQKVKDSTKIRGDINILLVGDPGTAKSELLKYTAKVAPRGLYTSGRGSTAAGLTTAVIRDKNNGVMMLEAGAVVLGDQGVVCIDEFDKLRSEDRSALHEVMEQQTCSVAKGGILATLNARTSILAAANPIMGKYDIAKNITENINLPIPLLTRFDLIFTIRDEPQEERDTSMALHILNAFEEGIEQKVEFDSITLTKYFAMVRKHNPKISKAAHTKLLAYYMQMRRVDSADMITVTPRQLEALIRLATARARILLKDIVDEGDAERAIFLVNSMLETVGIDVSTGKRDLGVLYGASHSEMSKKGIFLTVMKVLSKDNTDPVEEQALLKEMVKTNKFTDDEAREYLEKAKKGGLVYEIKKGFYARSDV